MARSGLQEQTNQDILGKAKPSCRSRNLDAPHGSPNLGVIIMTLDACQEQSNRLDLGLMASVKGENGRDTWPSSAELAILQPFISTDAAVAKAAPSTL